MTLVHSLMVTAFIVGTRGALVVEAKTRKNADCIQWLPFVNNKTLLEDDAVIRTKHQVVCRVQDEFGTIHLEESESSFNCILHRDSSQRHATNFEIAVQNREAHCNFFWAPLAFDVDPLGPNIVPIGYSTQVESEIAICKYYAEKDRDEVLGRMFLQGNSLFGHCGYLLSNDDNNNYKEVLVGGNFHALSATAPQDEVGETSSVAEQNDNSTRRNHLLYEIYKRVHLYLSEDDINLIESISSCRVEELLTDLNHVDIGVLERVLSMERFIPHDTLNEKGLSLLRAVLAEQMTLARRRRHFNLNHHKDAIAWERDGMLLKDFDYYMDHEQELEELLQMVAASKDSVKVSEFQWVERNVTSVPDDPQQEPHIDTFHSVVKLWVYERGVVTNETGPLHYMRGSNRNTRAKLEWMYTMSLPPATEAIKEPSLRFSTQKFGADMPDMLRPVLPLDQYKRTLIIADTSGIHHRGSALPGTVRRTIRVSSGNDGGLKRLNPFVWNGWDIDPKGEALCLEQSVS